MVTKCISDVLAKNARKVFDGVLQYQINLQNRYYQDDIFTMIFVQIENIKSIPKDEVQQVYEDIGNFLLQNTRLLDIVALISMDKFAILSPKYLAQDGLIIANKIKEYTSNKSYSVVIAVGEYNKDTKEDYLMRLNNLLSKKIGNDRKNHLV